jgi:predicted DNA-binding protein
MSRFTIDTDKQLDQNLNDLVKMTGGTKADVLRKAIATYKYLKTEDLQPKHKVSITNAANQVLKDVILP